MTELSKDPSVEQRFNSFGAQLTEQAETLSGLKSTTQWQNTVLAELKTAIQGLSEKLANVGRPQYALMISSVLLVIVIGGIFGSGYIRDQTRIETEVVGTRVKAVDDAYARGRLDAVVERNKVGVDSIQTQIDAAKSEIQANMATQRGERMAQLASLKEELIRDVELLDERLQREVGQINLTTNERVSGLDIKLQLEMAKVTDLRGEQIRSLRADVDRLIGLIQEQLPRSVEDRGRLDEQVKAIRARIDALENKP